MPAAKAMMAMRMWEIMVVWLFVREFWGVWVVGWSDCDLDGCIRTGGDELRLVFVLLIVVLSGWERWRRKKLEGGCRMWMISGLVNICVILIVKLPQHKPTLEQGSWIQKDLESLTFSQTKLRIPLDDLFCDSASYSLYYPVAIPNLIASCCRICSSLSNSLPSWLCSTKKLLKLVAVENFGLDIDDVGAVIIKDFLVGPFLLYFVEAITFDFEEGDVLRFGAWCWKFSEVMLMWWLACSWEGFSCTTDRDNRSVVNLDHATPIDDDIRAGTSNGLQRWRPNAIIRMKGQEHWQLPATDLAFHIVGIT